MENVIKMSKHGIAITREKMPAIKAEIREKSQSEQPLVLDFNGVKGLEIEAAKSLFDSFSMNPRKVIFVGTTPIVDVALSIGGRTVKQGVTATPLHETRQKRTSAFSPAFSRAFTIFLLLLTLGVGQVWAGAGFYEVYFTYSYNGTSTSKTCNSSGTETTDLGTLTADFKINSMYLKYWKDGSGNMCGGLVEYYINSDQEYIPSWTWTLKGGNNHELSSTATWTIAKYDEGASGSYTFWYRFKTWGSTYSSSGCGNNFYVPTDGSSKNKFTYKIAPPAISSFSVSESGYLSGTGAENDPYIIPYNGTLTLTVSGSKGRTDANSTIKYWKNSGDKQDSNVLTVTGITSTTKTSVVVHAQCINNSSSSLVGTESTKTVYYKSEAAYSVTVSSGAHGSVSPSGAQSNIGTLSGLSVSATPSTGYNFNTWTISSGSGSFTSAATTASNKFKPTAASTITASFTAKQTTVTLSANAPGGQTVTGGGTTVTATYDATLPAFVALSCTGGYALKGYYDNTSGGNKIINADGSFNANSGIWNRTDGATLTLHAQWSLDRTLTYSGNGNTGGSVPADPVVYANGASVTVLGNTNSLVKTGYTFNNWNTEAGGGGSSYSAGNTITMNANYTLYAQWRENNYTVTVNAGSNGSVASGSVTGHYSTKVTLPTATANTGYHFSTWTTTSGSVTYTNQTSATEAQVNGLTAAATVRADFAANTYSVVFNKNGGTGTMSNQSFTYDAAAKALTANSYTRSGYTFLGWATTAERANALTVDYTNGQSVRNLMSTNGGTFNLYAVWAKKYYIGGRFQHDWEEGSATTNEMTYDGTTGYYKFESNKTVSELSVQWHNTSGNYDADQYFYIHTGLGKGASSSQPTYVGASSNGHDMETKIGYSNAYVLTEKTSSFASFAEADMLKFTNTDNLSSAVIVWWDPANRKVWYTATESLNTNYYLLGFGEGSWSEVDGRRFKVAAVNATTATVSVSLTAKTYSGNNDGFKVENGGTWYTKAGSTITRASNTVTASETGGSNNNMSITADLAGSYTFTLNLSTKAISVTYPTAYQLNYSIGSVAGTDGSISTSPSTSSGSYVGSGNSVTLTGPAAKTGYTWKGWYTNAAGTEGKITDTNRAITVTMNADKTLYACYTINNHAITHSASSHGTYTIQVGSAAAVSTNTTSDYGKTITLAATPATGYHFGSWSAYETGTPATTITVTSNQFTMPDYAVTVGATFTPNTYTIHFNGNGNTSGSMSDQTGVTYDAATTITANAFAKTGYNFGGWATTQERANAGTVDRADGAAHGNLTSTQGATAQLWAVWTAKTTTISYSQSGTGYGSGGQSTTQTATYDAAMPTPITTPTAANGYAFMGYYDVLSPLGTQYYNADGTSANTWDKEDAAVTLYAYFKKAEITALTLDAAQVAPGETIGVTPTVSPNPTGTTTICWEVRYADSDNPLSPQPAMTWDDGKLTFAASETSGLYKIVATLKTGNDCAAGTTLSTTSVNVQVAGSHTVTVAYKHSSTTIKASTSVTARPLVWSDEITAPDIFGYTFSNWTAVDGVTIKNGESDPVTTSTNATIQIKATYNGTLTANYTPKNIVYFKDNLGWTDPEDENAHIYVNLLTDDYWNDANGSGNNGVTNRNLQMDRVPGTTDVFYYDYGSKPTSNFISFTKESMATYENFHQAAPDYAHVVFPSRALDALGTNNASGLGFYAATPMFVPLATQTPVKKNSDRAAYYNDGYWTKYLPGTGYTLQIYNAAGISLEKEIAFTSADELMPMKVVTDLEGGHTYKFQLKRDGDVYYGNNGTMTYADHGQNTAWDFYNNSPFNMCTIVTNAAGDYTFNLSYSPNNGGTHNRLRISVDYPVASGDYRLVYTDDVHTNIHPSAIVNKVNNGTDIVSFFVREDETPVVRIQQATVDGETGAITWNEYPDAESETNQITGSILSAITKDAVYNFYLSMNGSGELSVDSAKLYTGNYYIRTDAANSKWDNYRTDPDHLMTYSEYLKSDVGYTHYYTHWVNKDDVGRKNVKFVIANDYSPCISDTLARETASGTWANIASFIEEGGDLKRSANVRFMWDEQTNNIERAYIDGSQEDGTHFLELLSADGKIKNTAETETLTAVTFSDNGNWIYEANIKAQPNAQIKLKSTWGEGTIIEQYFKGAADDTEPLIGGSGDNWYAIRVLYDFKTNRLVAAYVPATGTYNTENPINADVMFIREHQGDIAQLTFGGSGAISDIKTAYGVLRLNKWTLNNKDKSTHNPLAPELSRYERDLFYISFPFRVNLEEVFGFGTYGTHWIIEEYDGAGRAANGFWADTPTFWRFITNRKGKFLEPNTGYIVAVDLDELGETSSVWANTDQVELYFPSYGSMPDIKSSSVTYEVPAHTCTIGPRFAGGDDRRIKDSHWNVISVPTYINTSNVTFANTDWITAGDGKLGPNFLYTVNWNDNSLTPTTGAGYTYKAMHAYIVQYKDNITWTTSVSPALAPRRNPDAQEDVEFRIELSQNEEMIDQAFVRMSNDENITSGFEFNYDMSKEFNKNKANIYTMVSTMIDGDLSITETAGNCLPMTEQTTIVPMGVQIAKAGEYTISIPSGTNGVGVTLIDNETGLRTNLALEDYRVELDAATYNNRFIIEISPIVNVLTNVEQTAVSGQPSDVRKVIIDQKMYIIKDGKVYDAQGARVK